MRVVAALLLMSVAVSAALAASPAPPAPAPTRPSPAPAFEPEILRLAELLGTLSFMSELCSLPDAPVWRARMAALLASEPGSSTLKDMMTGSFNRGFRTYEATYRVCTPNAQAVIGRSLDEAGRLATSVVTRFGAS